MAIIILDLDYTLFNAEKFKADLARVFNLSAEEFNESYRENFKDKNISYSAVKHLKILGKEDDSAVKEKLSMFMETINRYLLPQAEELLEKLKPGNRLIMISYGDEQWQKIKLENLRIKKCFNREDILCVNSGKKEALDFLRETDEEITIINDNAKEGMAMQKYLTNSELYITKGPYSHNTEHGQKIYTLNALEKKLFPGQAKEASEQDRRLVYK